MKDIIIIGGGPAGLTAAVYALRSGKSVLLFEKISYGGQISKSHLVENYPAIKSISGFDFSMNLYNQAKDFGCEFKRAEVIEVIDDKIKTVKTNRESFQAKAVIFALGCEPKKSGLEKENAYIGRGVSYCAVCDGNFYKNKDVAVVGGGNTAIQDAIYLSELCNKVYLIHRRDTFRAQPNIVQQLKSISNVELVLNSVPVDITGENLVGGIKIKNTLTDEIKEISVSGIFFAIGQIPPTEKFKNILSTDSYGYITADDSCKIRDGIYVCGDCRSKKVRQLTTAVSDGTVASIEACEYIDSTN